MKVYLAGNIPKHHEKEPSLSWTDVEMGELKKFMPEIVFLNPALREDDLSDERSVFGRDMLQVYSADAVLVDLRERRGIGVGAEMMWARVNQKPVIAWAPKGTHYNLQGGKILGVDVENYLHPFVASLADRVVCTLEEAVEAMQSVEPAEFEAIGHAMKYYIETQYENDAPMMEVLKLSEK